MKSQLLPACIAAIAPGLFFAALVTPVHAQYHYPFQDPNLPEEVRVTNMVSLMTLDEKVGLLRFRSDVPRLGIPRLGSVEGIHGEAMGGVANWAPNPPIPTTIFPQGIGMAETWDTEVLRQAGAVEGYEVRYIAQNKNYHHTNQLVVFAPNADLGRDPRWGRTEECYGEDPFFNGTMAVAFIKGLQGDNPRYWQTASLLKHFFANSNENGREGSSSDFDEALFREYYSAPFRMGFEEGGARCFMASYNAWNKIPCTVQPAIKDVAMKEWGVDGIICTDAGGYRNLVNQYHYFATTNEAAAACIKAGINHFLDNYHAGVIGALTNNLLAEADLDEAIKGVLRIYVRLGLLDPATNNPYAGIGTASEPEPWTTPEHKAVARLVAQKSIVLLKNSENLLPLDKTKLRSIAVVGPRANQVLLDWYSGMPPYMITPLQGIMDKAGSGITVNFATNNAHGEAVKIAKASDVVIVCVGNHPNGDVTNWAKVALPSYGREAVDRQSITLEDEKLIKQVYRANPKTIVVLVSSFPYAINWTQKHVPAIIHLTHSSQEEGNALADVLFGDYNPAGRLVETWPVSLKQLPPMMDYNIRHGRTYMYFKGRPLYPFGYGLSYTTFEYSDLKTSAPTLAKDGSLTVSVNVKNTGNRAGEEVIQLYTKHQQSALEHPIQELRGFKRVALQPGDLKTVEIPLTAKSLAYWDNAQTAWTVEGGIIEIRVGGSSADTRLTTAINVE
jgi:beta-glucosidase